ncbi:DUF6759 domain-containing protein [Flavobacterium sp.]|uniref:DUF6759 domain-containing protein n=1 Tax=Flavobacterium sp. TaxID=239 RepID=UPI003527E9F0
MKSIIFSFFALCFLLSCKVERNDSEIIEESFDSANSYVIDSAATSIDDDYYVVDSAAAPIDYNYEEVETVSKPLTYDDVKNSFSIYDIKQFIKENPNHKKITELEKRIIDLEVENIFNDANTGQMPSSEKISYGNSKISEISITNDTSCDLTIRYSGPESKVITILPNRTKAINLLSGNYRIAASACGYNYAGSESLNGDYTSSYYITTTRY